MCWVCFIGSVRWSMTFDEKDIKKSVKKALKKVQKKEKKEGK